jgi:REP element-mobilizing transposase RayT
MPVYFEHTRRSVRLPSFDYATPGAYFVTICTYERECLFGEILTGEMYVNEIGKIIEEEWLKTAEIRHEIILDEHVVMPNHFHGIVWILDDRNDAGGRRGTARRAPTTERFGKPVIGSIPTIVRGFKSAVTKRVNEMNPLFGPVWQRNYYERIIRSDAELDAVRKYIRDNPAKWEEDTERK